MITKLKEIVNAVGDLRARSMEAGGNLPKEAYWTALNAIENLARDGIQTNAEVTAIGNNLRWEYERLEGWYEGLNILNEMGQQGWELCSMVPIDDKGQFRYIFKRLVMEYRSTDPGFFEAIAPEIKPLGEKEPCPYNDEQCEVDCPVCIPIPERLLADEADGKRWRNAGEVTPPEIDKRVIGYRSDWISDANPQGYKYCTRVLTDAKAEDERVVWSANLYSDTEQYKVPLVGESATPEFWSYEPCDVEKSLPCRDGEDDCPGPREGDPTCEACIQDSCEDACAYYDESVAGCSKGLEPKTCGSWTRIDDEPCETCTEGETAPSDCGCTMCGCCGDSSIPSERCVNKNPDDNWDYEPRDLAGDCEKCIDTGKRDEACALPCKEYPTEGVGDKEAVAEFESKYCTDCSAGVGPCEKVNEGGNDCRFGYSDDHTKPVWADKRTPQEPIALSLPETLTKAAEFLIEQGREDLAGAVTIAAIGMGAEVLPEGVESVSEPGVVAKGDKPVN